MHSIDRLYDGGFSSYIEHHESTFTKKLDSAVKDRAIQLLFGEVNNVQRFELYSFMDGLFESHHCMSLYISDIERSKKRDISRFHKLCKKLGLDPGKKEVQINENCILLFTNDYLYRPVPVVVQ